MWQIVAAQRRWRRAGKLIAVTSETRPWYLDATPLETLPWRIRLRWATAIAETIVVLFALTFPHADFPLHRLELLIAVSAISQIAIAEWLRRGHTLPRPVAFLALVLDILLLTGLLELTGGPFNPFAVIYAVHIALAAVMLGSVWTWSTAAIATACYGVLFYWHAHEVDPVHHRLNDFPTHLLMMWIAIATTAELAAYFVGQASNALARRERELEQMRARAARSERLISLTTLAAGAAHELSTPLATIALASRELERTAQQSSAVSPVRSLVEDARLIRAEVDRCRAILDQMSGRAGGIAADDPEPVDVGALITELTARLSSERAGRLQLHVADSLPVIHVPRAGFAQTLLSLLNNAFDASAAHEPVSFTADTSDGATLRVRIHNRGARVDAEVLQRAGEPFFTTKEPGHGLGLGLFLARVFAERCGGALTLESRDGTTASLELPLASSTGRVP